MAQYICPSCGSKFFMSSRTGGKKIFQVAGGRTVDFVQMTAEESSDVVIDTDNIFCGACSWQGSLDEVVKSQQD